jgi:hypothetical protein
VAVLEGVFMLAGSAGPLASAMSHLGLLTMSAWIACRYGPMLLRITGCCSRGRLGVRE